MARPTPAAGPAAAAAVGIVDGKVVELGTNVGGAVVDRVTFDELCAEELGAMTSEDVVRVTMVLGEVVVVLVVVVEVAVVEAALVAVRAAQRALAALWALMRSVAEQAETRQGMMMGCSLDWKAGSHWHFASVMAQPAWGTYYVRQGTAHSGMPLKFWAATRPATAERTNAYFMVTEMDSLRFQI